MDAPAPKPEPSASPGAGPSERPLKTLAEFLESTPPDVTERVPELVYISSGNAYLNKPELNLHCESCNGIRIFYVPGSSTYLAKRFAYVFVTYECRNCGNTRKTFALVVARENAQDTAGHIRKLGEHPSFGPPVPSRVITLVGRDRELFLKGGRAELHGLGIGAFAYYRRVVEEQKGRIIEEIGKVAARLGATPETLRLFEEAKNETQFSTAIEKVKAAIPESLRINGHNPLTLLHSALSEGLHANTDGECLELATSIRLVLTELAERISVALKDEAELKQAVGRLLSRKSK